MKTEALLENYSYDKTRHNIDKSNSDMDSRSVSIFDMISQNYTPSKKMVIEHLQQSFVNAKDKQGVFGKICDKVKNIFNGKYCSNKVNESLNTLSEESTEEEIENAKNLIEQYETKQKLNVDTIISTMTTIAIFVGSMALASGIGKVIKCPISANNTKGRLLGKLLTTASSVIIGSATNVCLYQAENMTDNIEHNSWNNDKNLGKELSSGALSGIILSLYVGISQKVSAPLKKVLGLKDGVFLTQEGMANILKTGARTAVVDAASGAAASTLISDGKYLIKCAKEKDDTEFSWRDLLTTTFVSAVSGGFINGLFGFFKGVSNARSFNKDIEISQLNTDRQEAEPQSKGKNGKENFIKKNAKSMLKRKIKNEFKKSLKKAVSKKKPITPKSIYPKQSPTQQYLIRGMRPTRAVPCYRNDNNS